MTPLVLALALTGALPGPQSDTQVRTETALARAIAVALPYNDADGSPRWSPLGVRLGREVNWHLSEPGSDPLRDLPGVFRRVGWLRAQGVNASVAVCGDLERVRAVALSLSDFQVRIDGVVQELAALHVSAAQTARVEAAPVQPEEDGRIDRYYQAILNEAPAHQAWTIRKDDNPPASLTADRICTPPGTRHATHCWVRFTVRFEVDDAPPFSCPLPGRFGA